MSLMGIAVGGHVGQRATRILMESLHAITIFTSSKNLLREACKEQMVSKNCNDDDNDDKSSHSGSKDNKKHSSLVAVASQLCTQQQCWRW